MLVPMKTILDEAKRSGYAVPAPNVWDEGSVKTAIEAATEESSPLILDYGEGVGEGDIYHFARVAVELAQEAPVPVAINLDHGKTFEGAIKAIRAGFTSVMVDRSTLPFEQNVQETKEIVKIAHSVGVSVEAELGHVGEGAKYGEQRDAGLTKPEEAAEFVRLTGVDCLAVAIGTAHGIYHGEPHLDFERLAAIREAVDVPLVLHGGSGTGDENLKRAAREGISKVNLFTDLSIAGREALKEYINSHPHDRLPTILKAGLEGYKNELVRYMRLFNSSGQV